LAKTSVQVRSYRSANGLSESGLRAYLDGSLVELWSK